jgi:hypothetical protein
MIPYDSSQQSNQLVPYENSDSMYYSNSNEDEGEDFNTLNQGLALIARAFNKFSNKTKTVFALHQTLGIKLSFKMGGLRYKIGIMEIRCRWLFGKFWK